ncbi:MAG: alanine--tRNA ligase [Patescibacteria group bacterium]|nr:alanine--tRNA ligase [Patescibacteria group bacterium]MDE2014950.1 alanine--tRNA ligase [Patescibacteria group bacterium]MDE2226379.1 alanine--tRNA ligase [Patescibacteria group bacterium]
MTSAEIRQKFLEFFEKRGHAIIPSASLVPENDPTTLFTGSGMQPLVPYLLGTPHPLGKRVANSQKSFRAEDIDEIGDNRHTTFFEMLGNWSFGDYWKQEQLPWFFEFLTDEIGLKPENLYVTVFGGDLETKIPQDDESIKIWEELFNEKKIEAKYVALGSEKEGSEKGMQGGRIFSYDVKKNWWSRAGTPLKMPTGEPGGPDSEVFYDFGSADERGVPRHDEKFGKECHPNCDCGRFLEIGNSVFMEYRKKEDGTFEKLKQRNVDFGGGLERITAAENKDPDIFNISALRGAIDEIQSLFGVTYPKEAKAMRIIADHIRAAVFLINDGVQPGNKERGYLLRRLIRKSVFEVRQHSQSKFNSSVGVLMFRIAQRYLSEYAEFYKDLPEKESVIKDTIVAEAEQFLTTLDSGLKVLERYLIENGKHEITGEQAFILFTTYGFPLELTMERAKVDVDGFKKKFQKHQNLSRTSSTGTFKGGLADHSEKTTRLHTAHHLLLKALQTVLGPEVKQRGSNITSERLRMDFSYGAKMTDGQKKETERIVNEKIAEDLPVIRSEIAKDEAEKLGAEHEFGQKYPDRVSVYSIGPKSATQENPQFEKAFSIEFCGGPHVTHTGQIGKFRISKEEAVGAGVRRIKGVVE